VFNVLALHLDPESLRTAFKALHKKTMRSAARPSSTSRRSSPTRSAISCGRSSARRVRCAPHVPRKRSWPIFSNPRTGERHLAPHKNRVRRDIGAHLPHCGRSHSAPV
jgi:hypothetical protein